MDSGALRPRRVGQILDAAVKLYMENVRTLMVTAATVVVPLQVGAGLILVATYHDGRDIGAGFSFGDKLTEAQLHARLGVAGIDNLTNFVVSAFTLAVCVKAVSDLYVGQPANVRSSFYFGLGRPWSLLALELVYALGLALGFVCLIIPGVWLFGVWAVGIPVLVIEGTGPLRALRRSRQLVKGRWWPVAGVLMLSNLLVLFAGGVVGGVLGAVLLASSHPSVLFAVSINVVVAVVSGVAIQPFAAAISTVLYFDLRVRHEGYDRELLAEQLELPWSNLPALTEEPEPATAEFSGSGALPADEGQGLPGGATEAGTLGPARPGFSGPVGPEHVGLPGGPPYWPPPPGWQPGT